MGRPRYQITAADQPAASAWIGRQLGDLPSNAREAFRKTPSPEDLQIIVDRFFNPEQRRRLHTAIRQSRHRDRHGSVSITVDGETADRLYQLVEWEGWKSATDLLQRLVLNRWNEVSPRMEEVKEWKKRETLALKAGQKLDK